MVSAAGSGGGMVISVDRLVVITKDNKQYLLVRERQGKARSFLLVLGIPSPVIEAGKEVGTKYRIMDTTQDTRILSEAIHSRQICLIPGKGEKNQTAFPYISFLPGRSDCIVFPLAPYRGIGPTLLEDHPVAGCNSEVWDVHDTMMIDIVT